jgi:hypothetical protein
VGSKPTVAVANAVPEPAAATLIMVASGLLGVADGDALNTNKFRGSTLSRKIATRRQWTPAGEYQPAALAVQLAPDPTPRRQRHYA